MYAPPMTLRVLCEISNCPPFQSRTQPSAHPLATRIATGRTARLHKPRSKDLTPVYAPVHSSGPHNCPRGGRPQSCAHPTKTSPKFPGSPQFWHCKPVENARRRNPAACEIPREHPGSSSDIRSPNYLCASQQILLACPPKL